ncbi:MAG TPA: glycosyltransferase [Stellaceae bacterium]|jgi:glycosyltransferase involved in cell wall biosynthesis|nr:glycosyltransferase [Stellaceae bacterium]
MTRLLQAMAGAPHGGAENFFVRLAGALQHDGQEQRVLIRRDAARAGELRRVGVAVTELAFGGRLDFATGRAFRREIAVWRPDMVLTWMSRATRFCPRGDFVHLARLGGYYDLKYYRHCDHLIGNTKAIVDYAVTRGWAAERVHYLPNFVPDPGKRPRLVREEGSVRAVALGRLHPNKAFDVLLDALAQAPGIDLWIAGGGDLLGALRLQASRLGLGTRVRFLGWRDDVWPLLETADFLVCPSRLEPLGNVVIEAWAAGVPVIATASDGPAALISPAETGLLVPVDDPGALAAAMTRLAGDATLRARLARAGRLAYEAEFTEAAVVTRYRDLFARMAR